MLERWNTAIDLIEENLDGEIDVAALAGAALTAEYHIRRVAPMQSSQSGSCSKKARAP